MRKELPCLSITRCQHKNHLSVTAHTAYRDWILWRVDARTNRPRGEWRFNTLDHPGFDRSGIPESGRILSSALAEAALLSTDAGLPEWMGENMWLLDDHDNIPLSLIEAAARSDSSECRQWAILNVGRCET